ncbi:helix-turn-helix transcriptional regulator [Streptomyces sp. NBC_01800]|uniref:helix-turn-helix transcriptional regulator n=1 Tax=Streptomyces sp. NBC_01800 TaxID=2975945 RepID=UPI002DD7A7ED|nr:helix-turn-helix transcriptional regulator [Streptomyces sp. NBC_01800]WSA69590.1 helix-turn-helix transcriptional regulator [Streptomyces sp. NBC_01800]
MSRDEEKPRHSHGDLELCASAIQLYTEALRSGRIARADLAPAPCLLDMALVHPDPRDDLWMRPVPPSAALAHLLQPVTREIHERIRRTAALADSLAPLASVVSEDPNLAITVIEGKPKIRAAVYHATANASEEVLTMQPGSTRPLERLEEALPYALSVVDRRVSLRHLYQHSARYSPHLKSYLEQIPPGHLQVRTIEQTAERLLIFDRAVAFVPATPERDVALEIRHPGLVRYLVQVYEALWAQAVPIEEHPHQVSPGTPVTAVQRSIARLLVEGHVDDAVARKLGISVRTCRSHIAKLMQALNASSRTHLGALIIRSGIVEPDGATAGTADAEGPPPVSG